MARWVLNITIIFLLISIKSFAQEGLVGYWSFDKVSSGTAKDYSGFSNNATVFEGQGIQGIKGTALEFNGSSSFATIKPKGSGTPEVISKLGEGSISVWLKVGTIPLNHGIAPVLYYGSSKKCDYYDAANMGLIIEVGHSPIYPGDRNLFFTIWKDGCTDPSFCFDTNIPIELNKWYHFVAVVGQDFNTGYLNGKELVDRNYNFGDDSYSQFFADAVVHEEFWLGKGHWDRTTQYFDGAIDELKIFNRPLNKEEVVQLFSEGDIASAETPTQQSFVNPFPSIYPNPASERIYVNFSHINFLVTKISIINADGKTVITHLTENCGNGISLENIPPGFYQVRFIGEKESVVKKLMVVK